MIQTVVAVVDVTVDDAVDVTVEAVVLVTVDAVVDITVDSRCGNATTTGVVLVTDRM